VKRWAPQVTQESTGYVAEKLRELVKAIGRIGNAEDRDRRKKLPVFRKFCKKEENGYYQSPTNAEGGGKPVSQRI